MGRLAVGGRETRLPAGSTCTRDRPRSACSCGARVVLPDSSDQSRPANPASVGELTTASARSLPTARLDTFEYGNSTSRCLPVAGSITRQPPLAMLRVARDDAGHPRESRTSSCRTPTAARRTRPPSAAPAATLPSRSAYRFHQLLRSETKYSVPSGDQRRLKDRFVLAARHEPRLAQRAVGIDRRDVQLRVVPRHVRMIPREPRELACRRD